MALRIDANYERAYTAVPWSGGSFTIAFWMYRLANASTTRFVCGMLDTDDATPEGSANPRMTIGTTTTSRYITATYADAAASSSESTSSYAAAGWSHVCVVFTASGTTLSGVQVYVDGAGGDLDPGSGNRTLTPADLDTLVIGYVTANHPNIDIAHWAYWDSGMTESLAAMQTTLPSAIGTPLIYCPFLTDAANYGSGGATYDFTLAGAVENGSTNATITDTNDGTLPALTGGASGAAKQASYYRMLRNA